MLRWFSKSLQFSFLPITEELCPCNLALYGGSHSALGVNNGPPTGHGCLGQFALVLAR